MTGRRTSGLRAAQRAWADSLVPSAEPERPVSAQRRMAGAPNVRRRIRAAAGARGLRRERQCPEFPAISFASALQRPEGPRAPAAATAWHESLQGDRAEGYL